MGPGVPQRFCPRSKSRQTDLVGISPQQIFRGAWLQKEFTAIDIGFKFPSQPTGVIRRARSISSAAAQFAIKNCDRSPSASATMAARNRREGYNGLALSSVLFIAQLCYSLVLLFEGTLTAEKEKRYRARSNLLFIIGGAMVSGVFITQNIPSLPNIVGAFLAFFGFVAGGMGGLLKTMIVYKKSSKQEPQHVALMIFIAFGLVFGAGMVACELELHDKNTYQVITKSEAIENVRILRSSSSGFIIAVDGKVNFIPQSEIKQIKSLKQLN